jgi:hypothetical protein
VTTADGAEFYRIFAEALPLPASERDAYLHEACNGDLDLRARIESLLVHDADDELELPLPNIDAERLSR